MTTDIGLSCTHSCSVMGPGLAGPGAHGSVTQNALTHSASPRLLPRRLSSPCYSVPLPLSRLPLISHQIHQDNVLTSGAPRAGRPPATASGHQCLPPARTVTRQRPGAHSPLVMGSVTEGAVWGL